MSDVTSILVDAKQIAAMLSISSRTMYRLCLRSDFPKPKKLGSLSRWVRSEIEQYIATGFTDDANVIERAAFIKNADRSLVEYLLQHENGTIDNVVAELPVGVDAKAKSFIGRAPEHCGAIEKCGEAASTRKSSKMRRVTVWRVANRDAANEFVKH